LTADPRKEKKSSGQNARRPGRDHLVTGGGIIQESLGAIIPLQTGGFVGIGTHNADRTRPGELKPAIHLIRAVLFKDEDVEEITREQFEEHCRRIWAESRP
jgi:hypothetical protein